MELRQRPVYGIPHGWGANLLMYNTDSRHAGADVVGRGLRRELAVQGQDHRLRLADLHRRRRAVPDEDQARPQDHEPVRARRRRSSRRRSTCSRTQNANIGEYWTRLRQGDPVVRVRRRRSSARPGRSSPTCIKPTRATGRRRSLPERGRDRLVGHLDDRGQGAAPELHVQVDGLDRLARRSTPQVAEWFGEAPANPRPAPRRRQGLLRPRTTQRDAAYASKIYYWTTPDRALPGRPHRVTCTDYAAWTAGVDRDQGLMTADGDRRTGDGRPAGGVRAVGVARSCTAIPPAAGGLLLGAAALARRALPRLAASCCSSSAFWSTTTSPATSSSELDARQLPDAAHRARSTARSRSARSASPCRDADRRAARAADRVLHGQGRRSAALRRAARDRDHDAAVGRATWSRVRVAGHAHPRRRRRLDAAPFGLHGPGFGLTATIITLSYLWLPYMVLPIYAGARAAARLAARGVRRPRRQRRPHVPRASCSRCVLPVDRRRLDLHVLAVARRLHHGADRRRQDPVVRQHRLRQRRRGEQPAVRGGRCDVPDHRHGPATCSRCGAPARWRTCERRDDAVAAHPWRARASSARARPRRSSTSRSLVVARQLLQRRRGRSAGRRRASRSSGGSRPRHNDGRARRRS